MISGAPPKTPVELALPRVLSEIAHTLDAVDSVELRIVRALDLVKLIVPYDRCALVLLNEGIDSVIIRPEPSEAAQTELVVRLRALVRLLQGGESAGSDGDVRDMGRGRSASHLALPLVGPERLVGLLFVEQFAVDSFDDSSVALLSVVAAQLGAYLTVVRLVAEQTASASALAQGLEAEQLFTGIVSHDLRNPLSAITLTAERLLRRDGDTIFTRDYERILASGERALGIVAQLLDATQTRLGGGIPVVRVPMDLEAIVNDAVEEARASNRARSLRWARTGSVTGLGDGGRLEQVVSNLLGNALRYGPEGEAIDIVLDVVPGAAEIRIHNGGRAIPADILPKIFDPFKRGRAAPGAGVGLGLYIVREIVKGHEGVISARSSEAEGTTFTVSLPGFAPAERGAEVRTTAGDKGIVTG